MFRDCQSVQYPIHVPYGHVVQYATDGTGSTRIANRIESPELYSDSDPIVEAADELMSVFSASSVDSADDSNDETNEGVSELIVSQIEIADVIIMNKIDLLTTNDDDSTTDSGTNIQMTVSDLVTTLNLRAISIPTEYCHVPIASILGVAQGQGIAQSGLLDDHKDSVQLALAQQQEQQLQEQEQQQQPSSAMTASSDASSVCADVQCTDPTHDHSHASTQHIHKVDHQCTDPIHDHSHSAAQHHHTDKASSDTSLNSPCSNVQCTDPTHDHSHASHDHENEISSSLSKTSTTKEFEHGKLGSFVYTARRPFHPRRFLSFLRYLPVRRGLPEMEDDSSNSLLISETTKRMMKQIIRSKGFVWFAHSHVAALYMSQAGANIDISCLGSWWATLPRSEWPDEVIDTILQDFDCVDHVEEMGNTDEHDEQEEQLLRSVGDRRQELVFIGSNVGMKSYQENISKLLNECLLNDMEYKEYCSFVRSSSSTGGHPPSDQSLQLFPLEIDVKQAAY